MAIAIVTSRIAIDVFIASQADNRLIGIAIATSNAKDVCVIAKFMRFTNFIASFQCWIKAIAFGAVETGVKDEMMARQSSSVHRAPLFIGIVLGAGNIFRFLGIVFVAVGKLPFDGLDIPAKTIELDLLLAFIGNEIFIVL